MRPLRIIDLFCGAGLVADGLLAAGFEILGVDIVAQPRYPGAFLRHDALTLDDRFFSMADAVWASPPCLKDTALNVSARREQAAHGSAVTQHPDLITPTRALLRRLGKPYVIENVYKAPLLYPAVLNGFMFGLGADYEGTRFHLERKRKFETNWPLAVPAFTRKSPVIGVYGGHARCRAASAGGRGTADFVGVDDKTALMREAMGVERHMTGAEVSQGIPPRYARWVGDRLAEHLRERAAA